MEIRSRLVGIGHVTLGIAFIGLGLAGVLQSLAPVRAALPDRSETLRKGPRPEVSRRVERLRARLRRAPGDTEIQLQLGYACAARAIVTASQDYSEMFPRAMEDGSFSVVHFEAWRCGWFRRDRDGDMRRALHLARRVLAAPAPSRLRRSAQRTAHSAQRDGRHDGQPFGLVSGPCAVRRAPCAAEGLGARRLRLGALQLMVLVMRQQSRDAATIPPLREIVALAPGDRLAWLQLGDAYRAVGNHAGFRAARRRALAGPGSS
jgi:hypothetical protein